MGEAACGKRSLKKISHNVAGRLSRFESGLRSFAGSFKTRDMKKDKRTDVLGIRTYNFKVGKRYYSFNYDLVQNGELIISKELYHSSHTRSPSTIKRLLQNGWGTELVLDRHF